MTELQRALEAIGGFSNTSKMPWLSFSLPATECKVGSKLAQAPGTVCHGCYALKGFYRMSKVQSALQKRYDLLHQAHNDGNMGEWVGAFVTALTIKHKRAKGENRFRWHDSGDLQGDWHLSAICDIARRTPELRHWLPTKEYALISSFPKEAIPANLMVRVSHPKLGHSFKDGLYSGFETSTVGANEGHLCNAPSQDGECRSCDACWRGEVRAVDYRLH